LLRPALVLVLLLGALGLPGRVAGEDAGAATAALPPALPAIPAYAIGRATDDLAAELAAIEKRSQPDARTRAIEAALPGRAEQLSARLDQTRLVLRQGATTLALEQLAEAWSVARSALEDWSETLAGDARGIEAELAGLAATRERWQRSLAALLGSDAPSAIAARARGTLDAIEATQGRLEERRREALLRQDAVEHEIARCDAILAELEQAHGRVDRLLGRSGHSLLDLLRAGLAPADVRARVGMLLRVEYGEVAAYTRAHAARSLLAVLLFVALAVVFRRARGWTRARGESEEEAPARAALMERPYSAALLTTLWATVLLFAGAPVAIRSLVGTAALIPLVRLLQPVVDPSLRWTLDALVGVVVLDRVRWLLAAVLELEQGLLLVELACCLALAVRLWSRAGTASWGAGSGLGARLARRVPGVLAVVFGGSVLAAGAGYAELANGLGGQTIRLLYAVLLLQAVAALVEGLVGFTLRVPPLVRVRALSRHRASVEQRLGQGLDWAAALWVAVLALYFFGVLAPVRRGVGAVLAFDLAPGDLHVTVGELLALAATIVAAFVTSRGLRVLLEDDVYPRARLGRGVPYALSSLLHYAILTVGFLLALTMLGVNLDRITVLMGAFGVGLGFGLQNVVGNFVAGLILLLERPVQVGDLIQLSDLVGEVHRIGIRSSTLRTLDGAEVLVPNGSLISDRVTNWTLSDQLRRVDLAVGVAYGTDLEAVIDLLRKAAALHPRVCSSPSPAALFAGFGESALDFQLRFWTEERDWMRVRSEVGIAVHAALREAGIPIPFPQREVRVRGPGEG
jgi:small-conductance mechanosensitive channel